MRAGEPWRQIVQLLASSNVMDLKRPREVYGIFLGLREWPEFPKKKSMSGNEWSLEEIPAEEEILAGRGGSPGRPGRRPWAAGEAAAGRPGGRLGGSGEASWEAGISPPGASVGGTTLVAPNGPKRSQNRRFP